MTAASNIKHAARGPKATHCPNCGSAGVPSTDLLMASMLGSELPLDFEVFRCPSRHYWRIWDDGTIQPVIPEPGSFAGSP